MIVWKCERESWSDKYGNKGSWMVVISTEGGVKGEVLEATKKSDEHLLMCDGHAVVTLSVSKRTANTHWLQWLFTWSTFQNVFDPPPYYSTWSALVAKVMHSLSSLANISQWGSLLPSNCGSLTLCVNIATDLHVSWHAHQTRVSEKNLSNVAIPESSALL